MKNSHISLFVAFLVALTIFFISSVSFPSSGQNYDTSIQAIFYHIIIFFFLTSFLVLSLSKKLDSSSFFLIIFITLLYGILDELHQVFVPGRGPSVSDVFLDSFGGAISLILFWIYSFYNQ